MSNKEWHNATRKHPCPICHGTDWCNIKDNGEVAICHRVPSDHPMKSGGWLHVLSGGSGARCPGIYAPHDSGRTLSPLSAAAPDFAALHAAYWADVGFLRDSSAQLGVPEQTLRDLDVRYCCIGRRMSFPMRDAEGKVIGLRYRTIATGEKYSAKGSRNGLFMPRALYGALGDRPLPDELYVAEGATDTLAGLAIGLPVVGRSSCDTGTEELKKLLRRLQVKRATIIGDNDEAGIQGAGRLRDALDIPARVVFPPSSFKDLRAWYQSGQLADRELFDRTALRA